MFAEYVFSTKNQEKPYYCYFKHMNNDKTFFCCQEGVFTGIKWLNKMSTMGTCTFADPRHTYSYRHIVHSSLKYVNNETPCYMDNAALQSLNGTALHVFIFMRPCFVYV